MNMVEVRVEELSGAALDWAVAKVEGFDVALEEGKFQYLGLGAYLELEDTPYSTCWGYCGHLVDKYKVGLVPMNVGRASDAADHWFATAFFDGKSYETCHKGEGATALVASCRAVVGLILGPTVSVPVELVTP